MRTIRVTGKGNIKVKPDMTRLTITVEGQYKDYAETLVHSSEDTETLKDLFSGFGFERSDLKTLSFNVDTVYESYRQNGDYKKRFVGYKFSHRIKVELESDNVRLGKILYALANSDLHPEFRISYTVKDKEGAKNELLSKAVEDAIAKAKVLSAASGVKLGDIQTIDYSWGHIDFEVKPVRELTCSSITLEEKRLEFDVEPDDIDVSDTVTVVFEIM